MPQLAALLQAYGYLTPVMTPKEDMMIAFTAYIGCRWLIKVIQNPLGAAGFMCARSICRSVAVICPWHDKELFIVAVRHPQGYIL